VKVTAKTKVSFSVLLELDEHEARTMLLLSEYDPGGVYDAINKSVTSCLGQNGMTRDAWITFMNKAKVELSPGIRAVDDARKAILGAGVKP